MFAMKKIAAKVAPAKKTTGMAAKTVAPAKKPMNASAARVVALRQKGMK